MAECIAEEKHRKKEGRREQQSSADTDKNKIEDKAKKGINLVSALIDHSKVLDSKLLQYEEREAEQKAKETQLQSQIDDVRRRLQAVDDELSEVKSNSTEDGKNSKTTEDIQNLIATYERLKSDEKKFKQTCHEELERLQLLSDQAEDNESSQGDIEAQLSRAKARVEAGRAELAALSRKVATLKRQMEQVPTRTELREYRLRFTELYNQVSATHRQTKHFFSLYNSLEDTKRYLEKELSLLNSIVESYQQACQTASGREEFLRQLSNLSDGMKESCSKVDKRFHAEKVVVEKLQQELQRLVEQKVAYDKCLRDLASEIKLNDQLITLCKKHGL